MLLFHVFLSWLYWLLNWNSRVSVEMVLVYGNIYIYFNFYSSKWLQFVFLRIWGVKHLFKFDSNELILSIFFHFFLVYSLRYSTVSSRNTCRSKSRYGLDGGYIFIHGCVFNSSNVSWMPIIFMWWVMQSTNVTIRKEPAGIKCWTTGLFSIMGEWS